MPLTNGLFENMFFFGGSTIVDEEDGINAGQGGINLGYGILLNCYSTGGKGLVPI